MVTMFNLVLLFPPPPARWKGHDNCPQTKKDDWGTDATTHVGTSTIRLHATEGDVSDFYLLYGRGLS